jgi:hypothetical protein
METLPLIVKIIRPPWDANIYRPREYPFSLLPSMARKEDGAYRPQLASTENMPLHPSTHGLWATNVEEAQKSYADLNDGVSRMPELDFMLAVISAMYMLGQRSFTIGSILDAASHSSLKNFLMDLNGKPWVPRESWPLSNIKSSMSKIRSLLYTGWAIVYSPKMENPWPSFRSAAILESTFIVPSLAGINRYLWIMRHIGTDEAFNDRKLWVNYTSSSIIPSRDHMEMEIEDHSLPF